MDNTVSDGNSASTSAAPTSFADVYASAASSATDTPDQSSPPAAAETPPTDQGAAPAEREPFIPRDRFDEVNTDRNALKQWKEQYAWAEQIPREQLNAAMEFYGQFNGADPIAALRQLAQRLQDHPEHGPKLKSFAARALAQAKSQPQPPAGPDLSRIAIDLGNGQQIALADLKAQWLAEAEQKFAPFTKTVESIQAEKAQAQREQHVTQFTTTTFEDAKTWPGMDNPANQKAVGEALRGMSIDGDDPREVALALNAAYRKVVLPQLGSKAQSQLLDTLQQKAAANTSVNPGSAASSVPSDIRSFHDKRLQWS